MRVALVLECSHDAHGGAFQQALSTIERITRKGRAEYDFVVFTTFEHTRQLLLKEGIESVRIKQGMFRLLDRWSTTVIGGGILRRLQRLGLRRLGRHLDALLDDHGIDLVLLTETVDSAMRIGDHPIIVTVLDLDHRDYPEFPEIHSSRTFERIERALVNTLTRAMAVVTNSPSSARRIASLYQVDPERIIELPFLPSLTVRRHAAGDRLTTAQEVSRKYNLPDRYVFYPGFFFPFKNHLYLLEGLVALERKHGIVLHAVLCGGGSAWHRAVVERQVQALKLTDRVHFLGLVPDQDIPALYEGALALVMPAYNGPANLPPLEAVTLGCPVICSDLAGCREQMGDAALYCNLADVSSLADHLAALIRDPQLRARVQKAGQRLAAEIAKIDYNQRLACVFDNYSYVRRRWIWPQTPSPTNGGQNPRK
jgi:glycosyltransferase involved in cell wall biosynthesis